MTVYCALGPTGGAPVGGCSGKSRRPSTDQNGHGRESKTPRRRCIRLSRGPALAFGQGLLHGRWKPSADQHVCGPVKGSKFWFDIARRQCFAASRLKGCTANLGSVARMSKIKHGYVFPVSIQNSEISSDGQSDLTDKVGLSNFREFPRENE